MSIGAPVCMVWDRPGDQGYLLTPTHPGESKMILRTAAAGALAWGALAVGSASAQTPEEIIQRAVERYEERMAGIDNYTVVQEFMGFETELYFEKRMVDGRPVFQLVESMGGAGDDDMGQMYHEFMEVAERAQLKGKEKIGEDEVYVLYIEDFSGLDMGEDEEEDFKPKKGTFYLGTDDYLLHKVRIEGEMEGESGTSPVTMEVLFEDYREVKGMVHPFRMVMSMTGLTAGMSEEDREEARRSLEELRARMAEMPEAQRSMMEGMMKDQISKLEEMINSGTMQVTLEVKELRVNEGPPGDQ